MSSPAQLPANKADRAGAACTASDCAIGSRAASSVVALVGNPNTGKSTLFNALTGSRRTVANYPGVTVDVGRGTIRDTARPVELLDLPGTYSLVPASPDEQIVADVLRGCDPHHARPGAILAIADASNLRRNLYLTSHLLEVGLPVVLALNMIDVAEARGIRVDARRLSERLGIPVVPIVATDKTTLGPLIAALDAVTCPQTAPPPAPPLESRPGSPNVPQRYAWVDRLMAETLTRSKQPHVTGSDRIDRVLTHKLGGALFLLFVLYVVFQSIFYGSALFMDAINAFVGVLKDVAAAGIPEGVLRSLVVDGVLGGVGGVLAFLPQIMLLFAFIAVLEDCGYMARAAFMMDRLMRSFGLSGRAFIPMLSSFACAVPAIMATRTIADRRERTITILLIPFMSCSARLPVYLVLIGALVPDTHYLWGIVRVPALVMLGMYLVGVFAAVPVAWLLRNAVLRGPQPGFMLELPSYKWPRPGAVWRRAYLSGRSFLVRAGTVILLVNIVIWALAYFPHRSATRAAVESQRTSAGWSDSECEAQVAGAYLRESFLGRAGRALEPVIRPLGWDWRIGVSVIASFPAREVIIATLGTLFNLDQGAAHGSEPLLQSIRSATWDGSGRPLFTLPVALSIMVFFALCAQCASTLVMIGRETHSWAWPIASFVGMTTIAYLAAWAVGAAARGLGF